MGLGLSIEPLPPIDRRHERRLREHQGQPSEPIGLAVSVAEPKMGASRDPSEPRGMTCPSMGALPGTTGANPRAGNANSVLLRQSFNGLGDRGDCESATSAHYFASESIAVHRMPTRPKNAVRPDPYGNGQCARRAHLRGSGSARRPYAGIPAKTYRYRTRGGMHRVDRRPRKGPLSQQVPANTQPRGSAGNDFAAGPVLVKGSIRRRIERPPVR